MHQSVLKKWKHHNNKIDYVVKHKYEPDFIKVINGQTILLEAKGRFWDYAEYSKYVWIRESLSEEVESVDPDEKHMHYSCCLTL